MTDEKPESLPDVGEMNKRREVMTDEKRYIIYYSFGKTDDLKKEKTGNETHTNV